MKPLSTLLANHPFWNAFPAEYFPLLESCASLEKFRPREKIFERGNSADSFLLLISGEAVIETPFIPGEGVISVQTVGAGEPLGWSWLFPPYQWNFTVHAVDHVEAISLNAAKLRHLAGENPAFGYQLALRVGGVMFERLESTRARLVTMCEAV
jgi:CRP/FNR family cyclic AMP-dependent transcriptional regulator